KREMHKSTFFNDHDVVSNDPNSTFVNSYTASYGNAFNSTYQSTYDPPSSYKSNYDIPFPSGFPTGHHHTVGHLYTTENYPSAFLPVSGSSSSDSSPVGSPTLLPRRVPSSGGLNDHFMLDQQTKDCSHTMNSGKVRRKSSRASIRSNRNSMLLDPIVEEELPMNAIKNFGSPPSRV
ncbi:17975_t:CDS:1, partial [Acaulospora morrowiae]